MHQKGLSTQTKVLLFKQEIANDEVKKVLDLTENNLVYKLVRLRYIDNKPNVLVTTYIPYQPFSSFSKIDFSNTSLYDSFKKLGRPIHKVTRLLEVISSDETTADLLNINKNSPVFYFHSYGKDKDDKTIEYSISKYRGDINSFLFDISNTN